MTYEFLSNEKIVIPYKKSIQVRMDFTVTAKSRLPHTMETRTITENEIIKITKNR